MRQLIASAMILACAGCPADEERAADPAVDAAQILDIIDIIDDFSELPDAAPPPDLTNVLDVPDVEGDPDVPDVPDVPGVPDVVEVAQPPDAGPCPDPAAGDCCNEAADCLPVGALCKESLCEENACVVAAVDGCVVPTCAEPGAGTCVAIGADADVWIEADENKNSELPFLIVGKQELLPKKRTLIRFPMGDVPAGAEIVGATLHLYHVYSHGGEAGLDRVVRVHTVVAPWVEDEATSVQASDGVDWSAPYLALGVDATQSWQDEALWKVEENGWRQFDVTGAAQLWHKNAVVNYGLLLLATNEDEGGRDLRCASREYVDEEAWRPRLEVVYE